MLKYLSTFIQCIIIVPQRTNIIMEQIVTITKQNVKYTFNTKDTLGEGSYGKVYSGKKQDNFKNEKVAIKEYHKTKINKFDFKRQSSILKELNQIKMNYEYQKYILKFIDSFQHMERHYLVTELCDYMNLDKIIKEKGKQGINQEDLINSIIEGLVCGMYYLHYLAKVKFLEHTNLTKGQMYQIQNQKLGIMHRDLKPANIFFQNGIVKLGDFGFAKVAQNSSDDIQLNGLCGTPVYQSPEILNGQKFNMKTDVWSVGIILYQILYGKRPYSAQSKQKFKQYAIKQAKTIKQKFKDKKGEQFIKLFVEKKKFSAQSVKLWQEILLRSLQYHHQNRATSLQLHNIILEFKQQNLFKINKEQSIILEQPWVHCEAFYFETAYLNSTIDNFSSKSKQVCDNPKILSLVYISICIFIKDHGNILKEQKFVHILFRYQDYLLKLKKALRILYLCKNLNFFKRFPSLADPAKIYDPTNHQDKNLKQKSSLMGIFGKTPQQMKLLLNDLLDKKRQTKTKEIMNNQNQIQNQQQIIQQDQMQNQPYFLQFKLFLWIQLRSNSLEKCLKLSQTQLATQSQIKIKKGEINSPIKFIKRLYGTTKLQKIQIEEIPKGILILKHQSLLIK